MYLYLYAQAARRILALEAKLLECFFTSLSFTEMMLVMMMMHIAHVDAVNIKNVLTMALMVHTKPNNRLFPQFTIPTAQYICVHNSNSVHNPNCTIYLSSQVSEFTQLHNISVGLCNHIVKLSFVRLFVF